MAVRVQTEDFDISAEIRALLGSRTDVGAVATFTGLVRGQNDAGSLSSMTLEHYPGMTERELYQRSRKYRALDKRGRLNIMASLEQPGQIARAEVPTPGERGRKRLAWVATAPETDDNNA